LHWLPIATADISLGVMLVSAVILLLHVLVVWRICRALGPDARLAPLIAAGVTAFYFPLVFWSLRGMEVGLLVLLIDLAVLQCVQVNRIDSATAVLIGATLAAAMAVRMDAALQAFVILAYVWAARKASTRQLAILAGIVGATIAAILVFQQAYFGDALPNTYYQKMAGGELVERLQHGTLVFLKYALRDVLLLALVAATGFWMHGQVRAHDAALLASLFVVQCLYSVWIGGDYAEPEVAAANRFITQGMAPLFILYSLNLESALAGQRVAREGSESPVRASLLSVGVVLVTLLIISGAPWLAWAKDNAPLLKADIRRVRAGLAIAGNTSADITIAVHAAGQIPYYSQRRAIDLLGLNDPVIARGPRSTAFYPGHDKWNYEHSIAGLQPDLIADNWIRLGDYIKGRANYRKLANGMYIRVDTTLVDEAGLLSAFP